MSRHTSPSDALRERYSSSRMQPQQQTSYASEDKLNLKHSTMIGSPVTTVYEEEEEEEEEFEDCNQEEDDASMYSSSSSIPDENINFDLVYALHTFVATVDGQASVVKGDAMTLLDDSNSYWWLIRALKTSEVGYIPAENIETPFERLARLNKHRNIEVTSLGQLQHYNTVTKSSRIKKKVKVSRELACQLQIIIGNDEDEDEDDNSPYEEAFEQWSEEMSSEAYRDHEPDEEIEEKEDDSRFAPILNPDFNRPIDVQATSPLATIANHSSSLVAQTADKPLPELVESQKDQQVDTTPPEQPPSTEQASSLEQQGVVTGLKRLLSIGKKNKPVRPEPIAIENSPMNKSLDTQYHVLRIFAGNINVGALFSTVAVTSDMNADQLVKIALEKFHIPLLDESNKANEGIEYYLTVKSMDSDEITLLPQDKPLKIFESLNDHLTTPMPSLTYIKRLSMEQPSIKVTRVGVSKARQRAKARFGEDSVIRFALHKRIKRTIETSGQIYVKISYHVDNKKHHHRLLNTQENNPHKMSTMGLIRKSSLLRVDQQIQQQQQSLLQQKAKQERIDKLVAVSLTTEMLALTHIALEKFHLTEEDPSLYYISLSVNGKETPLNSDRVISDVLGDPDLIPKGITEKLFVLRKSSDDATNNGDSSNRRFMRFLKQDKEAVRSPGTEQASPNETSTGNVLKRLDHAILSLENDKRQLDNNASHGSPHLRSVPVRSNSLSSMISTKQNIIENRKPPTRSSSLKITNNDAFDTVNRNELSNMEDLKLELKRIASSHSSPSVPS
ncbi:uncharacterized protein B0P05DRAFT_554394 [Gilbertella persicaria]|uniref:uncharacterized protein n=1 Tax=Gilbertella persicaria TaxID=101096 RepID=UPI00221FF30F|nr:uncharacterized protein B0P05DRAFT_554394 [Gilbertella persicaria]KAI8064804.1 hypothetical protein B0P05DRAFT_554394 [Gilbertella persicaria]